MTERKSVDDVPYRTHLPRRWKNHKVHCNCNSDWEKSNEIPGTHTMLVSNTNPCPKCGFFPWIVVTNEEYEKLCKE